MKSRTYYIISVVILLSVLLMTVSGVALYRYLNSPVLSSGTGFRYVIKPGTTVKLLVSDLYSKGELEHPLVLEWLMRLQREDRNIQAGEYFFPPKVTPQGFIRKIVSGDVIQHKFTIIPGETYKELVHDLDESKSIKHTIDRLSSSELASLIGTKHKIFEGLFAPNKYFFPLGESDVEILKRAYLMQQKYLGEQWQHRAKGLPYKTDYQALTAASLIEREVFVAHEMKDVASVIVNRLHKGMKLQIDATVLYAKNEKKKLKSRRVYYNYLKVDSPYNTYRFKGLPPTPIAFPSHAAIHAALHPNKTQFLYYVLRGDGSGAHVFSKSLAAHQRAVEAYRDRLGD